MILAVNSRAERHKRQATGKDVLANTEEFGVDFAQKEEAEGCPAVEVEVNWHLRG